MDELLREFVIESTENLQVIDQELMVLERNPESPDTLASVFRAMHTIKGTAGFFDLPNIERLAHSAETLLGQLRDGVMVANVSHVTALLIVADTLRTHLQSIEENEREAETDSSNLIATLAHLSETATSTPSSESELQSNVAPSADERVDRDAPVGQVAPVAQVAQVAQVAPRLQKPAGAAGEDKRPSADSTIRVDTGVLDELMTLMGELVLARNQLVQTAARINDPELSSCTQRLNHVASDLRGRVLKTRMRPVGALWKAIPRLARDTALACGKQVSVRFEGEDTELDKTVLEAIKDPLTHCVRNSVDHGIETPEVRESVGKNPEGTITLRARHDNGNVVVEISDDGAGINIERVRAKGLEQGLATEAELEAMSDRQVANLIFAPGFSTASAVTSVSGRGVGMDVVRTNAESIGGNADVSFVPGRGTTFSITVPLTLAIIPALIVSCSEQRFAIPQASVLEVVRAAADDSDIENLGGALVYRLRGELVALVDLRETLGFEHAPADRGRSQIVIVRGTGSSFGIIVDFITGNEEIVVRPLDVHYDDVPAFAGATVMGDGRVALILDVAAIGSTASEALLSEDTHAEDAIDDDNVRTEPVLIVELSNDHRVALPLDRVARLEKFRSSEIEQTDGERVVQYRGDILPLLRLGDLLGTHASWDEPATPFVVAAVIKHHGLEIGLEVARIVEVAEAAVVSHGQRYRVTTAISKDAVIDIVSLESLLGGAPTQIGIAA